MLRDENAVALEKLVESKGHRLMITNSMWAKTLSDKQVPFILIVQKEGRVWYEGHYTLFCEGHFFRSDRRGDWPHLHDWVGDLYVALLAPLSN